MTSSLQSMPDRLLSELQRQGKYLERLPDTFTFPLFNAKHALESQRASGYRTTAAAGREIVDNAVEAGAQRIHVVFDTHQAPGRGRRKLVTSVAFIDDGPGMLPRMARYALSWGGGTRFDDPHFIGKFGFGLPNASINQTKRTEVYTRTAGDQPFTMAWLDTTEFKEWGQQTVPEPVVAEPPRFVQDYLERNGIDLAHGTIVVWVNPDRLSYKTPAQLRDHLLDDFGVTYRYLFAQPSRPLEIVVEGTWVEPVDPLFLMHEGRDYLPADEGGAQLVEERFLAVKYFIDPETGARRLVRLRDEADLDADQVEKPTGVIHVRIARFPDAFLKGRRFQVRKPRRGMAFVRARREIETVDVFPKSQQDRSSGMGSWPLLQSYAYYWGVEVRFTPELDEVFGITHDKQSVRPIEDFWRVLAEAEIDDSLRRENEMQRQLRKRDTSPPPSTDEPTAAELAARDADVAIGALPRVPDDNVAEAQAELEKSAARLLEDAAQAGQQAEVATPAEEDLPDGRTTVPPPRPTSIEEARQAILAEGARRPYRIEFYDAEDGPFYNPIWRGAQMVVQVNRRHPFYSVLYSELIGSAGNARAMQAVNVLLLTLGKAELNAEAEDMPEWYRAQRRHRWSPYLETALRSLEQRLPLTEEDIAGDAIARADATSDHPVQVNLDGIEVA